MPLRDGLLDTSPKRDLARAAESDAGKLAAQVGLDLLKVDNPLLAAKHDKGRLFYLFFKTTENAFGDRPWLIQRIKKTERTWAKGAAEPDEKVTWQVEVFKLMNGALKRPDQHHGSFALRDSQRREIVKEYEIGFGTLPGVAEDPAWPFAADRLFELVQPYQEAVDRYDGVVFAASRKWSLTVAFAADGAWSVVSPELGIDAPKRWPDPKAAEPVPDASSRDVVLERGKGMADTRVGGSAVADLVAALGQPIEDVTTAGGSRLVSFGRSLSANVTPDGKLNTLLTRSSFAGRTTEGVRHGMTRQEVGKLLPSSKQPAAAESWTYDGLVVDFDADGRVRRLVITRPK